MKAVIAHHHTTLPSAELAEAFFTELGRELQTLRQNGSLRVRMKNCSGEGFVEVKPSWLSPRVARALSRGSTLDVEHETTPAEGGGVHSKVIFSETPPVDTPPPTRPAIPSPRPSRRHPGSGS